MTIQSVVGDGDAAERMRSLASVRRAREREKEKRKGGSTDAPNRPREVVIPDVITVQELSNRMAVRGVDIIKFLMKQGLMMKINDVIDSDTAELVFEDCEVPEDNIMGPLGGGAGVLMSGLDYERAVLAAGPLGIMQAALDVVLPYVRDRKQFGKPIGSFQLMQGKIADMYVALNSARAYVYAVARACDAGKTSRKDAAGAILFAGSLVDEAALVTALARGLGAAMLASMPARSSATSSAFSRPRRHTAPSRAKASMSSGVTT